MFNPSRDEVRRFFAESWRKYRSESPLTDLEKVALDVILLHPEYHSLLENPDELQAEYSPETGRMNPFLHLSLHLAIEEQLSIDQPRGIAAQYQALLRKTGSEHEARHAILECLGETMWQAQRSGTGPDERYYLDCLQRRSGEVA